MISTDWSWWGKREVGSVRGRTRRREVRRVAGGVLLGCSLLLGLWGLACTEAPTFPPRTQVGSVPAGFPPRPVTSPADAAAYVEAYSQALGVEDVRVTRVLGFEGVYWVYVRERETGRPAFTLTVGVDGDIQVRKFPAMEPEMMWNQKYGHEARPNPAMMESRLDVAEATHQLRQALAAESKIQPGKAAAYYGYFLFPLCEEDRLVGEAAVDALRGEVVWKPFPAPLRSTWFAPGEDVQLCR